MQTATIKGSPRECCHAGATNTQEYTARMVDCWKQYTNDPERQKKTRTEADLWMLLAQTRGHKGPKGMSHHTCLGEAGCEKDVMDMKRCVIKEDL